MGVGGSAGSDSSTAGSGGEELGGMDLGGQAGSTAGMGGSAQGGSEDGGSCHHHEECHL